MRSVNPKFLKPFKIKSGVVELLYLNVFFVLTLLGLGPLAFAGSGEKEFIVNLLNLDWLNTIPCENLVKFQFF